MAKTYPERIEFKVERSWYAKNMIEVRALDASGERLGNGQLELRQTVARVKSNHVVPGLERRGIGTKIYEKMAEVARENGYLDFCSDATLSPDSKGFWEKQVAKGRAELRDVDYGMGWPQTGRAYCMKLGSRIDFSGTTRRRKKRRK